MKSTNIRLSQMECASEQQPVDPAFDPSGQTPAEASWGTARKVAFRFAFSYLILYLSPPFGWLWTPMLVVTYADSPWHKIAHWFAAHMLYLGDRYENFWHKIVPWVGVHLLHLSYPIVIFPSSDTTYDYVRSFCFVLIASLITVAWSVLDRKRIAYSTLNQWTRLYVRMALAFAMLSFGGDKVIPLQMPPPSLSTLMQPLGDLTPYRLVWSFIGASAGYQIFCGVVEMLGGILLLIPGTTMLGTLVSVAAMANVLMLNVFYGIPVKFFALHLILFALFLLLPDVRRLVNVFALNRGTKPDHSPLLFKRRWLNYSVWGAQWVLGIYFIVITLFGSKMYLDEINNIPLTNPLYGIWSVDEFTLDGQSRPPLLTDDLRWQRMIFTSVKALTIQEMDGRLSPYALSIDTQESTLWLKGIKTARTSSPWWSELYSHTPVTDDSSTAASRLRGFTRLDYNRPQPNTMTLEGLTNGHRLRVTLKKEDRQFVLKTLGFRWINDEYDFFNEHADEINRVP